MLMIERVAETQGVSVEEAERSRAQNIPIGRMIEPEDIADLCLFLVSGKASAITGQSIAVDGGMGRGMFL